MQPTVSAVHWVALSVLMPPALLLSGCAGTSGIPTNCNYEAIAEQAIAERYPRFEPDTPLKVVRRGAVVEGYYPLPYVMPGGTAHAEVRISDCSVAETWLSQ